jgi:hypothetical protein
MLPKSHPEAKLGHASRHARAKLSAPAQSPRDMQAPIWYSNWATEGLLIEEIREEM